MEINTGDIGEMGSFEDINGEVYLSVTDLVKHLEGNKHRMKEVVAESITTDRFILLLKSFEKQIKEMP